MNEININGTLERMKMIERGASFSTLYPSDIYEIITALREKAERENPQPLMLDELREMDGEPVWIKGIEEGEAYWSIVLRVVDIGIYLLAVDDIDDYGSNDLYGKTWLAYHYKPKEVQNG